MSELEAVPADRKLPIMSDADGGPSAVAFGRLPDEIIEQILLWANPNSFASLILLNSNWRRVSQRAHLYAHQLALCPATTSPKPSASTVSDHDLPRLRRLFSQQIKRNLFDAYVRPKLTNITLISNAISSSSAPGGDGLQFSHSLRGHHLLAYNSSRIYVLDVQGSKPEVKRELKILRRPAAVCIVDDGSLLAVLSPDMQIDLYDLSQKPPRRKQQSLILDHLPRAIALSPCGSVLAAAYQGGIEVQSIAAGALPSERRAVKCDAVDSLAFSFDGTQLLGTTSTSQPPNTVILTAPYYDPGSQMMESSVAAMWTTSILFPNTSRDCSHAVLLQESSSAEAEWSFTYDRSFETFRAVRIEDLRNGTTYFPGPIPDASAPGALVPSTLPAANLGGQLVSAGFEGKDVWVYGVPEDLEAVPEPPSGSTGSSSGLTRGLSNRSATRPQETKPGRVPQWQLLCDKLRNNFVYGRKVAELEGIGSMKWVSKCPNSDLRERLVVCAKGTQPPKPITEEDDMNAVDGGRVIIIDFDYSPEHGSTEEITIDVGTSEAEILEEEQRDLATEVAIVRRRTVAQQRGGRGGSAARASIAARHTNNTSLAPPIPQLKRDDEDPLLPRRMATARDRVPAEAQEDVEDATYEEVQEALDAPYGHADPRSVTSLRRAATAAAMSRHRVPQAAAAGSVEYRRADGRREHPHESDADNWVPPPPPYSKDDPVDLPAFLRHPAIPGAPLHTENQQTQPQSEIPPTPALPRTASVASRHDLPRLRTSPPSTAQRRVSLTEQSSSTLPTSADMTTASTNPSSGVASGSSGQCLSINSGRLDKADPQEASEDLYDVSPPGSPRPAATSISPQITGHTTVSQSLTAMSTDSTSQSRHHALQPNDQRAVPSRQGVRSPDQDIAASPTSRLQRLSNSFTWPRTPKPVQIEDNSQMPAQAGHPRSAPPRTLNEDESLRSAPPPLPRPDQIYSLHNRQGSFPSRRASGMVHGPVLETVNSQSYADRPDWPLPSLSTTNVSQQDTPPVPDQPLIISTPQGISGAFDAPSSGRSDQEQPDQDENTVIHAPVARHPRPIPGSLTRGSTAERLETIYSPQPAQGSGATATQPLTVSSLRYHASMTRRESRAKRSAARNMQDAKGRGWRSVSSADAGKDKKKKKSPYSRKKKNGGEDDAASNGGWTDVTWASKAPGKGGLGAKSKKCIVM